jgi:hypothetical protein
VRTLPLHRLFVAIASIIASIERHMPQYLAVLGVDGSVLLLLSRFSSIAF